MNIFAAVTGAMTLIFVVAVSFYLGQKFERYTTEEFWKKALTQMYYDGFEDANQQCIKRLYVLEGQI